jgi:hypothetical protein
MEGRNTLKSRPRSKQRYTLGKTITRSFRIDQVAFDALREDAERKEITVNTLVNQLFLAHKDFDMYFERMGVIKISAAIFSLLLGAASEKRIAEVGRQVGIDVPKTIIIAKDGTLSLQTVLSFLRMMSQYACLFEYNEVVSSDGRSKVITLMHSLGRNGSQFIIHYVKGIFEGIGLEPKISSSEHSVVIEFLLPPNNRRIES